MRSRLATRYRLAVEAPRTPRSASLERIGSRSVGAAAAPGDTLDKAVIDRVLNTRAEAKRPHCHGAPLMALARRVLPAKSRKAFAEEARRALARRGDDLTARARAAVASAIVETLGKRGTDSHAAPISPP
jgi:hypothetical protein